MSEYKKTTFIINAKYGERLTFDGVQVYTIGKKWEEISDGPPLATQNPGIGNPNIKNINFGYDLNCVVELDINAEYANAIASEVIFGANLMFSVNGHSIYIRIKNDGSFELVNFSGQPYPKMYWNVVLTKVGEVSDITCWEIR